MVGTDIEVANCPELAITANIELSFTDKVRMMSNNNKYRATQRSPSLT